jgi:hypothetical protein
MVTQLSMVIGTHDDVTGCVNDIIIIIINEVCAWNVA